MSSGSFDSDVWLRGLTYSESARARIRRRRLMRWAGYAATVVLACLLAWVAVAIAIGP
jgi:hypothetical protein